MNYNHGVHAKKGDWVCSSCGDLNFASRTSCRKCSNPKTSGSSSIPVRAGDWSCPACNHLNFARNQCCRSCKSVPSLVAGRKTNSSSSSTSSNIPPAKPGDWSCSCGEYNFARNQSCRKCKNPKSSVPTPAPSSAPVPTTSSSSSSSLSNDDDGKNLCVVCMEQPAQMAITVCGHLCLCSQCAPVLHACPLCRHAFASTDLLKIFVSGV